jgi:hypothetical protein
MAGRGQVSETETTRADIERPFHWYFATRRATVKGANDIGDSNNGKSKHSEKQKTDGPPLRRGVAVEVPNKEIANGTNEHH